MPPLQSQAGGFVRRPLDFCHDEASRLLVATHFSPPAVMVGLIQDTKQAMLGAPLVRRRTWNSYYSTAARCFGTDLLQLPVVLKGVEAREYSRGTPSPSVPCFFWP